MLYELKIRIKSKERHITNPQPQVVTWEGKTEGDAALRYADAHRDHEVLAVRSVPHGLFQVGNFSLIVE